MQGMRAFLIAPYLNRHQLMQRNKSCQTAFTLIELVMVIAIMGILSIIAFTKVSSISVVKLTGAANRLASDLRYAQQLAISKQIACGIAFDPSSDSYFVYESITTNKAQDPFTRTDLIINLRNDSAYKETNLVGTNFGDRLQFDPWGRPYDNAGDPLPANGVAVLQSDAYVRRVVITPNTGDVSIQ